MDTTLDQTDQDLMVLEESPTSQEPVHRVFRAFHTIKGTSAFFGFLKLQSIAHAGESLLSLWREGKVPVTSAAVTSILKLGDSIRSIIKNIKDCGNEGSVSYEEQIRELESLAKPAPPLLGEVLVASGTVKKEHVQEALEQQTAGDPRHVGEIMVAMGAATPADVKEAITKQKEETAAASAPAEESVRVNVELLDKLMNLVGELVLSRNQLLQEAAARSENSSRNNATQRLHLITSELQQNILKTRMQPISTIWKKFNRVIRDLSSSLGKHIRLEMEGEETELDRALLEAIRDPMTHVVRNAVDHGIESPEDRKTAGKPAEGVLRLSARHEGGQINIEMSDDGQGLRIEKIRKKALEKGLITPQQAEQMTEAEMIRLVFMPGFSTADKVSNISGRGVGMDVVKTNIERIGGSVDITSQAGHGTTLHIKIPLTLAIIPALIVECNKERFAIPQANLLECILAGDGETQGQDKIEFIQGIPVYRLRGRLLPLVDLHQELHHEPVSNSFLTRSVSIAVLQADQCQFGLIVDQIRDTQEIVVKPLSRHLKSLSLYAGGTIMGDGEVALILDVIGLARQANILSKLSQQAVQETQVSLGQTHMAASTSNESFLICQGPDDGRLAILLSKVTRLEEFDVNKLESSGDQSVIQYRGEILPLISLSAELPERRHKQRTDEASQEQMQDTKVQAVIYSHGGKLVGLTAERILDVVETSNITRGEASRPGVLYTAVLQDRVTEVLDLDAILDRRQHAGASAPSEGKL